VIRHIFSFLLFAILFFSCLSMYAQVPGAEDSTAARGLPGAVLSGEIRIPVYQYLYNYPHPGLGADITGLGDINGDGIGDFAISTMLDTTFIYFGGRVFDGEPVLFVLGGGLGLGGGIEAGDFNGDGYTDIVTSRTDWMLTQDPEFYGLVRLYFHKKTIPYYGPEPDLQFTGRRDHSFIGRDLWVADVNGDGIDDLLMNSLTDSTEAGTGALYLHLGGPNMDTIPDHVFTDPNVDDGYVRRDYTSSVKIGDINGDGCDDLFIGGQFKHPVRKYIWNFNIYLGNRLAKYDKPDYEWMEGEQWYFSPDFTIANLNADCCDDIIYTRFNDTLSSPYIAWGIEPPFPPSFEPDTTFPNTWPEYYKYAAQVVQLGDIDGDGYKDYCITWKDTFYGSGVDILFYWGGPGWQPTPRSYIGLLLIRDKVEPYPIPIGDITGDGLDDFALILGFNDPSLWRRFPTVMLYKGERRFGPTSVKNILPSDKDLLLDVYPNPVSQQDKESISIVLTSSGERTIDVFMYDSMGRKKAVLSNAVVNTGSNILTLPVSGFSPGMYFLVLTYGEKTSVKPLTVIR